jgi:hypothetical protein
MAGLCREFGISRKTGYKILTRYNATGLEGLTDRSRRPGWGGGIRTSVWWNQNPLSIDIGTPSSAGYGSSWWVVSSCLRKRDSKRATWNPF